VPLKDKRKYLKPETVAMLDNMALRARLVVEGYMIGLHRSPYHGFSVEFAEHRAYGPGDDTRHVDWKLFGKTDRYYIKRFEEETNLSAHILLDISKSMTYSSGTLTKLDYGSFLAAALCYLMLNQQDAAGLTLFDSKIRSKIPPHSTKSHLNILLGQLDKITSGPDTSIGTVLHKMADQIRKRGLIILISDLLDDESSMLSGLKHFRHNKQEVLVFHILDREETSFNFNSRTHFEDLETGQTITTEPWQIRSAYLKKIQSFQENFRKQCLSNQINYLPVWTNQNLDMALNEFLKKRQKLG